MGKDNFIKKVDSLIDELTGIELRDLPENDACVVRDEIDRIIYECLYHRSRFLER